MPAKPLRLATLIQAKAPPPPDHLEAPEATLWRELTTQHDFGDPVSLAILSETLSAHQRARRCRETIDSAGETTLDRWGQLKPHPLLAAERDARAAFLSGMRAMNLDLGGLDK